MFYTNGIILIESDNDLDKLSDAIEKLERYFEMEKGIAVSFELDEDSEFPAYKIPEEINYNDMYDCLTPDLAIKGINGDQLKMPDDKVVKVKHNYTEEEIISMSSDQSERIMEVAKLKQEKAAYNKRMGAKISDIEDKINDEAQIMAQGYEWRDVSCHVVHNFEEKRVYYYSKVDEGVCVKSREMEKTELQLQLFVKPFDGDWTETNDHEEKKSEEVENSDKPDQDDSEVENIPENGMNDISEDDEDDGVGF